MVDNDVNEMVMKHIMRLDDHMATFSLVKIQFLFSAPFKQVIYFIVEFAAQSMW